MSKKILILYSEVMPYTIAVIKALVEEYNCEVTLVHWDHKKLTPFAIRLDNVNVLPRSKYSDVELINLLDKINPSVVCASGRMDKGYLRVCKIAKNKGLPVVMLSDQQWLGKFKHYLACFLSPVLYKPYFTHAWVAGPRQVKYCEKVGFEPSKITTGIVVANTKLFSQYKYVEVPKRKHIMYIGRLESYKGVTDLLKSYELLKSNIGTKADLILYGNGSLEDLVKDQPGVQWRGFVEQDRILNEIDDVAFFILPSRSEAWGAVLHEMAAAGFPIITTSVCGAAEEFVENGKNGIIVPPSNVERLSKAMEWLLLMKDEELKEMSSHSKSLAAKYSPKISVSNFMNLIWPDEFAD